MRILHVCTDFWPGVGGIEKFVLDLARHSVSAGIFPKILCFNRIHSHRGTLPAIDEIRGIPVRRIPFIDLKYYKPALLPMRELTDADLIHIHGIGGALDFAALTYPLHRRPVVLSTHGGIFHTGSLLRLKQFYFNRVHRLVQSRVACTVACSRQDQEIFAPVSRRLVLIENGVDLRGLRELPNGPRDPCRMLYVGRISRNKRLDRILNAFALLRRQVDGIHLRIVGADWEGLCGDLKALAQQLGVASSITFVGQADDQGLKAELAQAAWFVSASEYEGFGISAIEAMGAGCVPLLNDIPAFRNILSGVGAIPLVDYSDASAAAETMYRIMQSPREPLAAAARARAEEFSWERTMPRWVELYRDVARNAT